MSLGSLLRKELYWSRRNALVLVFLVLLVPVFFAGTSLLFQDVLPRNVPVAIVAEDDDVTDEELELVEGTIDSFTDPRIAEDGTDRLLDRESVYGVVVVPPDISEADTEVTVTWTADGAVVPFQSPSDVLQGLLEFHLDRLFDADVTVEREPVGERADLPEYLVPAFLLALTVFFAFTYVPYVLRREKAVLDRVRLEASLEALVGAKLLYLTVLMLVPVLVFHLVSWHYGYGVAVLRPGALAVLLLTFVFLAILSATVTVLTRFGGVGTFVNLVLMLGLLALSGLVFPRGFFSTVRTTVVQLLPTYYASVTVRSLMMKDVSVTTYLDWIAMLGGLTVLAVVALKLSIVHYRRTT